MEPERLEPTLAERLDASAKLLGEAKAAEGGTDEPTAAETRTRALRERLGEYRRRLVIEEPHRRWWRPKNR
jgi:hypothetical protein